MRKSTAGAGVLAATIVACALPVGASAAHADHPNTICSSWAPSQEASHHVQVDWMVGRSFRVAITDFTLLAAESEAGDTFVPLPLDPNLRLGTNTVALGEGLAVSDISLSQGVTVGPASGDPHGQIEHYAKLPHAPWESAAASGSSIVWLHDVDARSDGGGTQTRPSETQTSDARAADSAGVLSFTVTIPDSVGGEVALISGVRSDVTAGVLSTETETWGTGDSLSRTLPGCSVSVEPVGTPDADPEQDPEQDPNSDPDSEAEQKPSTSKHAGAGKPQGQGGSTAKGREDQHTQKQHKQQRERNKQAASGTKADPGPAREGTTGKGTAREGAADAGDTDRSRPGAAQPRGSEAQPGDPQHVARSGGSDAAPWIAGAAATAALGGALAVAARRSARTGAHQERTASLSE